MSMKIYGWFVDMCLLLDHIYQDCNGKLNEDILNDIINEGYNTQLLEQPESIPQTEIDFYFKRYAV